MMSTSSTLQLSRPPTISNTASSRGDDQRSARRPPSQLPRLMPSMTMLMMAVHV